MRLVCVSAEAQGAHVGVDVDQEAGAQQDNLICGEGKVELAAHVASHLGEAVAGQHISVSHHVLLHQPLPLALVLHEVSSHCYQLQICMGLQGIATSLIFA